MVKADQNISTISLSWYDTSSTQFDPCDPKWPYISIKCSRCVAFNLVHRHAINNIGLSFAFSREIILQEFPILTSLDLKHPFIYPKDFIFFSNPETKTNIPIMRSLPTFAFSRYCLLNASTNLLKFRNCVLTLLVLSSSWNHNVNKSSKQRWWHHSDYWDPNFSKSALKDV